MRVLVCGGRDYTDYSFLKRFLDLVNHVTPDDDKFTTIIHGGARGADMLAGHYAIEKRIPQQVFMADWKTYGKAAGPIRNQQMLDEGKPDVVIHFPVGRGTANMIYLAKKAGIPTIPAEDEPCSTASTT